MNDKVSPVKLSSKAYYRVPAGWRKQQEHSHLLAKTMKRIIIKQIRKQISPPRKSASETREPFRSQVIKVHK